MLKHPDITRRRLQAFASEANLRGKLYSHRAPVKLSVYSAPDRIPYERAIRGRYRPAKIGEAFGPTWSTHWFKVELEIPRAWKGREVHLLWDSTSEACVWQDGVPLLGLTGSGAPAWIPGSGPLRPQFQLARSARGGERQTLYVEIACNGLFGADDKIETRKLRQAEIAVFDRDAWDLLWDFVIVADMAEQLPSDGPRAGQALFAGNQMVNVCDLEDRRTWGAARKIAAGFFAAHNGDGQHNVSAVGHAHIDTAWLWPLAETMRKCYRTFSTAVRLMNEYPEYKFACSQAQQYAWMKEQQPALYRKIKAKVRSGQFVPCGGTWIEPDCNIPSGESLVRQFLVGQRFFRKEFGAICREFWNPDVFGYNGQLPQIMRGAGIRYFLTQKLSWNQFNKPTSHTFLWEGIDGSRVLTHFPPADTYNGIATVKQLLFNVSNFKDHDRARESYYLFGYGDGGGGPSIEMLEQLRRMRDVDGLPRVEQRTPAEFFARCEKDLKAPLVWVGELYFELHRGTYTTQARNKRDNRRSEVLLHDVEFLSAMAALGERGHKYPASELERLWKLVLLNQFHDIIPGSSITEVYKDSAAHYEDILNSGGKLLSRTIRALGGSASGKRVLAINTLSAPRSEVVDVNGKPAVVRVPAMGYAVTTSQTTIADPVSVTESGGRFTLENKFVRAVFRRDGRLASLFDKQAGREAIETGAAANNFVFFDDEPLQWEAWDVDVFHIEKPIPVPAAKSIRVTERGPLRVSLEVEYALTSKSRLKQTISLTALSPRLDFANEVDWNECHKFLKVEFPLAIRAENATYEIQFGHLQRPTHFNTSWDVARFEVSAHRWADLAEPDFGVALLNDSKYGYSTHRNVMRLSLLRSPKSPDPEADMGKHNFRYALLPHAGSFREAGVIEEAYRFNVPIHVHSTNAAPTQVSFFSVDRPNVIIDTIKKAEDSDTIIARLYEAHGKRATFRFRSSLPVKRASLCNLLEEEDKPVKWTDGGTILTAKPFQIMTLKMNVGEPR